MKILGISLPIFTTDFESTVEKYVRLAGEPIQRKFEVPSKQITVAKIGGILVIGGSEDALEPLRRIRATFTVDSIAEYAAYFSKQGAEFVQPPEPTPTGSNMIVKSSDGEVFEYVELNGPTIG